MKTVLVVLLSGSSRRFGNNKLLAEYQGKPLYQRALRLAHNSTADHVIAVTAYEEIARYCEKHYPDISVICNLYPEKGISESLKLGLLHAGKTEIKDTRIKTAPSSGPEFIETERASGRLTEKEGFIGGCCFLVGDQPLLRAATLQRLFSVFRDNPDRICLLWDGSREGNPVIFPHTYFKELLALEGDMGGKRVAIKHPESILRVNTEDPLELVDIDTMEDMRQLSAGAASAKAGDEPDRNVHNIS